MDNAARFVKARTSAVETIINSGIDGLVQSEKELRHRAEQLTPLDNWTHHLCAHWKRGRADATLTVEFKLDENMVHVTECRVNWSVSSYNLAEALTAAELHLEVVKLGYKIEVVTAETKLLP